MYCYGLVRVLPRPGAPEPETPWDDHERPQTPHGKLLAVDLIEVDGDAARLGHEQAGGDN